MIGFEARCPMRYPNKCNLSAPEKNQITKSNEKYAVFVMMPFAPDQAAAREAIKSCFSRPTYLTLIADEVPTVAVKTCKICRLALAADFGVVVLSPASQNVIFEAGMVIGLQKPVMYLNNPTVQPPEKLPFDVSDQVYIEFHDPDSLRKNLAGHLPAFLERVVLFRRYEQEFRQSVMEKLRALTPEEFDAVEYVLLEDRMVPIAHLPFGTKFRNTIFRVSHNTGIIGLETTEIKQKTYQEACINPAYRPILEDEFFRIAEERAAARGPSE